MAATGSFVAFRSRASGELGGDRPVHFAWKLGGVGMALDHRRH
jgi:hypothetical protein